jgi:hypothetical protein
MRLFVPGRSFVYLGFFMALSRYINLKSKKWLFVLLGFFLIIVMHVIRQYILISFFIGFFAIFKSSKMWKKLLISVFIFFSLSYLYEKSSILQNLVLLSEGQAAESSGGEENIREISFNYFFTEFSPNLLSDIFGNGPPQATSDYGKFYTGLNFKGMYMSDVGYAQIYALFGALGLLIFGLLFYKIITQKNISENLMYTKYFVVFSLLANVASGLILNTSNIVCLVFVIYILEIENRNNKINHLVKN